MSKGRAPPQASSSDVAHHHVVRDRYLFTADRKSSEYRSLLEITPGRARLLTPSKSSRRDRWIISIVLAIGYIGVWGWLFAPVLAVFPLIGANVLRAWVVLGAFTALSIVGAFLFFSWWDRHSLPMLADAPSQSLELVLLGARSFGTFQDVRARTPFGEEIHLVVDAPAIRFWKAVGLLQGKSATPG